MCGFARESELLCSPEAVVTPHIGVMNLGFHALGFLTSRVGDQDTHTDLDVEDVFVPVYIGGASALVIPSKINDPNYVESLPQHLTESTKAWTGKEPSVRNETHDTPAGGVFSFKEAPQGPPIKGDIKIRERIQ